jgi:superfamily I DNA and RNA helicase
VVQCLKAEEKIEFIIIDEAQDFDVNDYKTQFIPRQTKV